MKLNEWAKKQGISYLTAWRWAKKGTMPIKCYKLGNMWIVEDEIKKEQKVVLYARVSSSKAKNDLQSQIERLKLFSISRGYQISEVVSEISSGLNDDRKGLLKILTDQTITHIIVEHSDRLARFGTKIIEEMLKQRGCELIIIDKSEHDDDLVEDMIDIVTCFCSKLYGERNGKNKRDKILEELTKND